MIISQLQKKSSFILKMLKIKKILTKINNILLLKITYISQYLLKQI